MNARFRLVLCLCLGGAALAAIALLRPAPPQEPAPTARARVVREGVAFDFSLALAGDGAPDRRTESARVAIALTDASSGAPLRGLRPLAWMDRERAPAPPPLDDASCRSRIRSHLGGLLAARPDVDLNGYVVLALNDDNGIAVIDPQVAFRRTKLQRMIALSGRPEDWALTPDARRLLVTLPVVDRVAIVDAERLRLLGNVATGPRPTAIAIAPDGRSAWVTNEGDGSVSVIDVEDHEVRATLEGSAVAFHAASATAWVLGEGGVAIHRVEDGARIGSVPLALRGIALVASEPARAIWVASDDGRIAEIDVDRRAPARTLVLGAPADRLAIDPAGRWILAASTAAGTLHVIDAAAGRVAHRLGDLGAPDAFGFSDDWVYVRDRASTRVLLLSRAALGQEEALVPVQVAMGQRPPAAAASAPARASPFALAPEPGTMLVAHAADRAIYLYREGMMAPAGSHPSYGREARAALVLDRSLRERRPGIHEGVALLRGDGVYTVSILLESPRVAVCMRVEVEGAADPAPAEPPYSLELLTDAGALAPGASTELRFRVAAPDGAPPASQTVPVLIHRTPTNLQWRLAAHARGDGVYAVAFAPPTHGRYRLLAALPEHGLGFGDLPAIDLPVEDAPLPLGKVTR